MSGGERGCERRGKPRTSPTYNVRWLAAGSTLFAVFTAIFCCGVVSGSRIEPVNVERLTERIILVTVGDSPIQPNVIALKSDSGIVVFDTHDLPWNGKRIRKAIAEAFGSEEFYCVVNTNHVWDHTGGNQGFSDLPIIGHSSCAAGFAELDSLVRSTAFEREIAAMEREAESEIERSGQASERAAGIREVVRFWQKVRDDFPGSFEPTIPNITFDRGMTVDLGNMTMRLRYYGPSFCDSDILIHIPEERIIVAGEAFQKERLPMICHKSDIERDLNVLEEMLGDGKGIDMVLPAHGPPMSAGELLAQRRYIEELREAATEAVGRNLTEDETAARLAIGERFGRFLGYNRYSVRGAEESHERNVRNMWRIASR